MPTTMFVDVKQTLQGVEMHNVFAYYTAFQFGNPTTQVQLAQWFEANVIPAWQACMPSQLEFDSIDVRSSNYPFPHTESLALTGDLTVADGAIMPPWLPVYVKVVVLPNLNGDDGAPYSGMRPVRRGSKYFSGLSEAFNSSLGFVVPATAEGTAWTAFLATLNDTAVLSSGNMTPVVWGDAMPAAGSKPARGVIVAPVNTHSAQYFTKLDSRLP